ncbi:MAG: hemolysin family protein [candidate division WOR-3 bacterium]
MYFEILIILFLISLSFIFSSFEIAYITLSPIEIKKLSEEKYSNLFIKDPKKVLSTILFGNNFVNVGIAVSLTTFFYFKVSKGYAAIIGGIFSFLIIVTFGEIIPKTISRIYPEFIFSKFYKFIFHSSKVLYPPIIIIIKTLFKKREKEDKIKEEIFLTSLLKEKEKEISIEFGRALRSILRISEKNVKEIVKPRKELFAIKIDKEIDEIFKEFLSTSFTRIPFYKDSIDKIIGVLHVKDIQRIKKKKDIYKYLRKPIIVPENTKIIEVIKKIKEENMPFVIVIDEFGGISGFLTLYDIMLELIGETEFEKKTYQDFIIVDGMMRIDDLFERYLIKFPEGDFETINGFLLYITGRIPQKGEIIEYEGYKFEIVESDKKRVKLVKIYLPELYT